MAAMKYFAVFAIIALCGATAEARTLQAEVQELTGAECTMCKTFVGAAEKFVTEKAPVIDAGAKKLCAAAGDKAALCEKVVDAALNYALEFISTSLTPDAVCSEVGVCKTVDNAVEISEAMMSILKNRNDNDDVCMECKFAVETAHAALADNSTQTKIMAEAEKLCKLLSGTEASQCDAIVTSYGPMAINFLDQYLSDAEGLCEKIGFCSPSPSAAPVGEDEDGLKCPECKIFVKEAEKMLESNKTITKILKEAEKLCKLAGDKATVCMMAAEAAIQYGLEYMEANFPPEAVCKAVGECKKSADDAADCPVTDGMSAVLAARGANDDTCMECKFALETAHAALADNATVTKILGEADTLCKKLPSSTADECVALIAAYGPMAVNFVDQYLSDSEKLCEAVGFCSAPPSAFAAALASSDESDNVLIRASSSDISADAFEVPQALDA